MAATSLLRTLTALMLAASCALGAGAARAALSDLSSTPITTQSTTKVQPNLMFVFDDSGSMDFQFMPDDGNGITSVAYGFYGRRSSQCNGVYYNPNFNYQPPVTSTGESYPQAVFTSALRDGYSPRSGNNQAVNLAVNYRVNGPYDTLNMVPDLIGFPAYYYAYRGEQNPLIKLPQFFQECGSLLDSLLGGSVFTRVVVTGESQQQNFANWYSYYRNRLNTMKTASGLAFRQVDASYRVGFITLNNNNDANRPNFINVQSFDAAQRAAWYAKLYGTSPAGGTPLRSTLSAVGRMYANKIDQIYGADVVDPMQYSCQQNFTLLSTDGFWNSGGGTRLDGNTSIGNTDGAEPRPYYDGTIARYRLSTNQIKITQTQTLQSTVQNQKNITQFNGAESGWTNVATCVPFSFFGYSEACRAITTPETPVASCSARSPTASNNYVSTVCTTNSSLPNNTPTASCTAAAASASNNFIATTCSNTNTGPNTVTACTPAAASPSNNYTTTTCASTTGTGGTSNTLADISQYYYDTDLRSAELGNCAGTPVSPATEGNDVCQNNVPQGGNDTATTQHMTTFTLGLGAQGRMRFQENYQSAESGDYFDVARGTIASATRCTWTAAGNACNWPVPSGDAIETIDDLWHTAVNGRGTYFSATDPASLSAGLLSALSGVAERTGGTTAVAVSNVNVTSGDNFVFGSTFTSGQWSSQLYRLPIDETTLTISSTPVWEAQGPLDTRAYTGRKIYTFAPGNAATGLRVFNWANLSDAEKAYFSPAAVAGLSQLCTIGSGCLPQWQASRLYIAGERYRVGTTWYQVNLAYTSGIAFGALDTSRTTVITGPVNENLVNFILGERSNEGNSATGKFFRQRSHVLGDIVNADPVFVGRPSYSYLDAGYAQFVLNQKDRVNMVYAAANDGMLHAFRAGSSTILASENAGSEAWAYIPTPVLPNLYKLADKNYATRHQYYVDGTPTVGDVFYDNAWHTILVGGLGGGGRGYYALDITDPLNPKALWEFTSADNPNLGYSYGKPVITKQSDGSWVVLVTSGYNNGDNGAIGGDGKGYLYVLNAKTGVKKNIIGTDFGSVVATVPGCAAAPCPSGLGQISQFLTYPTLDNTALRVYGGDMYGNLWRFDINGTTPATGKSIPMASLVATLRGPYGNYQPIVTRPILSVAQGSPIVMVNTGRLMGLSDLGDTSFQSVYAIKDTLGASVGNPRESQEFVQQSVTIAPCPTQAVCVPDRIGSTNPVDYSIKRGWYMDLPGRGERSNVNMSLNLSTLVFNANVPTSDACTAGGYSFQYVVNYLNGTAVDSASRSLGKSLGAGLAGAPVVVEGATGKIVAISQVDQVGTVIKNLPIQPGTAGVKRVSWRELAD